MPMPLLHLALIAQLPLAQAGQLLLVIGLAFAIITLISSTHRFHRMVQFSEEDLVTVDDCNDFFFIQIARYLSKINRQTAGFGVIIVELKTEATDQRGVQEKLLGEFKKIIREPVDKACLYQTNCVAAIIDTEESSVEPVSRRIATDLKTVVSTLPDITAFRIGVSAFPMHGGNTRQMIDTAIEAMERVDFEETLPIGMAPPPEEEEKPQPDEIGELSRQDKHSSLDPLTGVLSPMVIGSYMRKYFAEIRRNKKPIALLCVGVTGIEHLISLHGEEAADAVIAGVSGVLQRLTRESDLIGRYHRDDFMVLAGCSMEQGEAMALRLHEAVQKETFTFENRQIKALVSVGVAAHPEHGRNLRDLFRGAYRALEVLRGWNTSSCLMYDPAQHDKKRQRNGSPAKTGR